MSDLEVAKIPRPKQMRGLLMSQIRRNFIAVFLLVSGVGLSMKFFVANPRKQKYADFYKNYDPYAEFERMRKKGLFQSCPPDEE